MINLLAAAWIWDEGTVLIKQFHGQTVQVFYGMNKLSSLIVVVFENYELVGYSTSLIIRYDTREGTAGNRLNRYSRRDIRWILGESVVEIGFKFSDAHIEMFHRSTSVNVEAQQSRLYHLPQGSIEVDGKGI